MKRLICLSIAIALVYNVNAVGTIPMGKDFYNVLDFGAVGNGKTLNTQAIQKALWYVVLPGYISGTHEITIGSAQTKTITVIEK